MKTGALIQSVCLTAFLTTAVLTSAAWSATAQIDDPQEDSIGAASGIAAVPDEPVADQTIPAETVPPVPDAPPAPDTAGDAYGAPASPPPPPPPAAKGAPPKKKGPIAPWKPLYFDNDFSYKKDPLHTHLIGEELKDIPLGNYFCPDFFQESTLSVGGELRHRFMDESNRLRGAAKHGSYDLKRWRQYFDYHYSDEFRVYVEMIDASIVNNNLPVTGIDQNRWDLLNAFFDVKVGERDGKPIYFRAGRQELLYGSQRLVSPLDWANTRRNFEGLKLFSKGEIWDLDAFVTRPTNTATPSQRSIKDFDREFDAPNQNRTFSGVWATYKGQKDHTFDYYWLWDRNTQPLKGFADGNRHTVGSRWLGNFPVLDCGDAGRIYHTDVEGGYQFGDASGKDVQAGFITAGMGHTWQTVPWEPNVWLFYDWASGSHNLKGGTNNTFNQLVPLAHAYLGLIDNVARQNISDINGRFTVKPTKKLNCQTAVHFLDLASHNDVLYTVTGKPLGIPGTGTHVGEELDLLATYTFNPNFNLQAGYFCFWYGNYVQNNAPRGTANQFYLQSTFSY